MFPETMLEYLVNYNSSITAVYIEFISDIKCQLHQFTFGGMFYAKKTRKQIPQIYISIIVPLLELNHVNW